MDKDFESGRKAALARAEESRQQLAANSVLLERTCRTLYERINNSLGASDKFRVRFDPAIGVSDGDAQIYIDKLVKKTFFGSRYEPSYGVRVLCFESKEICGYQLVHALKASASYGSNAQNSNYDEDDAWEEDLPESSETIDEFMMMLGEYFAESI